MNTLQKFGFHGEMATLNRSLFAYNKPLKVLHNKEWEYPGQKGGKTMSFNFNINGSVLTPKGEQYPAANYGAGMRVSASFNGTWDGYVYRYCFIVSGDKTYLFKMTKGDNDTWTTDLSGRGVSGTVINISFYGTKNEYPKNNDTANPRMTTNSLMIHLDDSLAGHITPSTNIDKSLASDILNAINTAESNSSSAGAAAHNAEEFAKQAQSSAQSAKDQADASARSAKASSDSATASGNSASYANERAVASQKSADASATSANAASASADTSKTQAQESARQAGIATQKAKDATDQADRAKAQADEATRQAGIATADVAETKKQVKLASDQADRAKGEADRSKLEADRSTEQANRSETQANTSEKSAKNAGISAAAALSSQQKAKTSEDNAKASETEATRQAGIATAQAIEATKQAGIATTQAGEAKKQATTATTKAQEASTSAQSAKTSAQEATRQAETAATQATEATKQAKIATTEAQEASTSATNAKASETKSQGLVDEAHKWHDEIMANIQSAKDNADVAVRQADRAKSEANRAESSAHNAMLSEKNAKESADKADSIKHFVEENVEKTTQQATAAEEAKNKAIEAKDQALSYRDEINSHLDEANDLHNKAMALDKQAQASAKASADSATASADSAKASAQSAKDAKDTASKTLTQATEIADGAVKTKKEVADLLSQTKASESETSKYAQQAQDSANASKSSQDEATHQATLAKNNRDEVFANIARAETGADMAMEQAEEATRQADIATEAAKKAKDYKVTVENLYDPITQTAEQAMKDAKKASDGVATINQSKADVAEMKETVLASQLDVETNKEIVKGLLAKTQQSEANAKASETKTAIETLKTATETSAKKASDSATAAAQSATNAKTSETTAIDKATEATTQAGKAKTSAETATSQATIATTKAGEASTSAGEAKTQAGIATTKATEASTSATAAAGSAKSASDTKTAIDQEKDRIDKAVDKLENLKIGGENLVDLTSLTVGRFDSSGSLYTQDPDSHYSTDFIRVKKDEPYTCSISPLAEVEVFTDNYDKTNKYLSVSLYGADKSYLGRLFIKSIPEIYAFKDHKYTFKPNDTNLDVAYVRLSFPQTLKSYVKLERGTIQTDYSISTRTMNKNFGSRISSIESKTKTYSESTYISLTELGCTQDTEDCSIIINKALKEQSKNILVPVGEWKIKKPIIMQSNGPHLIGVNRETCIIKKTTDDVDDIYGVNAAIIFGGANKDVVEGYNYTIKDITIRSHTLYHGYGIYGAINVGTANVSWMNIQKFEIGLMFPKNIWVSQFEDMNIADSDYGCKFTSSGTTMLMRNIYVMTPKTYGYYLSGLSYTHCENLACDWAMETATCYGLYFCGIVINGIGCESPKSKRIIDANNSNTSISQGYIEVNHDNEDAVVFRVNGGYMSFNGVTLVDTKQSEGKAKSKLYHVSTKAYVVMSNCLRNVEFGGKSITDDPQNRLTIIDGGVVTQIDNFTTSGNPHADPSLLLTNQRSGAIFWATYGHFHQTPAPEEKNRGWETQIASQGDIVIEANPEETGVVGYQVTDYKDEDTFKETVKEISSDGWITLNNNNCNSETHQGYAPMHVGREIKNQNGAKASIVDFIYRQGKIKIDKTDGFAVGDKLTLSKLIYHRDLNHVNIPALLYGPEHRMPTYDWSFVPGISYFDTDNDRYKMWNGAKWKDVVFKQDLRVGGVNLLRNTDTMDDSNYWQIRDWTRSDAKYDSTYNGEIGDNVGLSTTNLTKPGDGEKYFDYVPMLHLNTNETYTLSIYGYNIDRIRFFENLNDGGNHYHDSQNGMYDFVLDSETSEWQKFTITFKPSNKDFYLTFGINSTGNSWVSSIKLERGNVATNWSPSPADIKSKIEDAGKRAIEKADFNNINMLEDVDYMDDRWYFTMNDQIVQSVKTSEITEKNNEIVDSGSATGKNIVVYHSLNTDSTGKTIQLHYYGSLFLTKGNEYTFSIYGANLKSILLDMDYSDPDNPDGAVRRREVPVIIEEESKELSLYQATFEAPMTTGYSLTIYLKLGSSSAWATPKLEKGAYAVGQVRNKNDFIKAFSPFIEQDTAPNENLISWNRVMNRNCFAAKFDYQTKIWTTWVTKGDDIFGYGLFTSGGAHSWVLPYGESITYSFEVKPSERLRWQADVNSIAQSALGTDYTGNDIDKYLKRVYRKNGIKIPTDSEGKIKVDSYLEPNKWTKCSFTFSNTYADRNKNKVSIEDNNVNFGVVTNSLDAGKTVTVQYRNIKVEYGDKPTRFIGYKQEDNSGENFIKNSGSLGNARMSYAGTGSPETYAGSGYDKLVPSGRYLKFTANNSGISTFIDKWNYEDINLQAGESVTLSVYMKTDCDDSLSIGDVGLNFSAEFMSCWLNNNQLTNSWKRFILTGIANKDVSSKSPWNNSAITFYFPEFPKGKSLYISSPKLERGSVATAWSERPIDNNTIVDRLLSVIFDVAGPQELTKGSLIYRGQTIDNNCNLIDDSSRSTIKGISLALITELYNLSSTISIVVAGKTTGSQYSVDLYFIKGSNNIIGKQTISANVDKSPFFNITDIDRTYMEKMISLGVDSLIVSYKDNFDTKVKIYFRDAFASLPDSFFNGD